MKRVVLIFLIYLPLSAGYRWIKDAEVGIRVPIILKSPSDHYTQMFKIPFINMIGPGESVVRIKYHILTRGTIPAASLKVSINYHTISNFYVKDTIGYLIAPFSSTWLSKYNRLEFFLTANGVKTVKDLIELDSIWIKARVSGSKSDIFRGINEFVEESHGSIYLIYPDGKNVKTLSAIALFSQAIGFLFGDSVKLSVTQNPVTVDVGGIVVIGTPMEQPYLTGLMDRLRESTGLVIIRGGRGKLIWKSLEGENLSRHDGVLIFLYNNTGLPVIIISGNDPSGVRKALSALFSHNYRNNKSYTVVNRVGDDFFKAKWVAPPTGDFSFKSLGWKDITLRGSEKDTVLRINFLPGTHFSPSSNRIILRFKTNKYIDAFSSKVAVYFNDKGIGQFSIDQMKHDIELRIPSNIIGTENRLRISARLKGVTHDIIPYIEISNNSHVEIKRDWNVSLPDLKYLSHLAFPFGATYNKLKTAIVLDHMNPERFYLAIIFSRFIGLNGVINGELLLSTADSSQKYAANRNLVLIGHDFDIVSPADSSAYIEELVYPAKGTYRTFLILHAVDKQQINRIASIFKSGKTSIFLTGARINLSRADNKYVEPLSKIRLDSSSGSHFDYLKIAIFSLAAAILLLIIIRIWRAFA